MTVRVKICGLTEKAGLDACLEHGADWIGFNFFPRSPRFVTPVDAARLRAQAGAGEKTPGWVGLFVSPTDEAIAATLEQVPLDILQIYAAPARALEIRQRFGRPVWVSCPVEGTEDLPLACEVDGMVLESRPPAGSDRPGGNGVTFPWGVTHGWRSPAPWLLAGGLRPETVAQAVRESDAPAVDVASGVESAPGVKDPAAIARFIAAARATRP